MINNVVYFGRKQRPFVWDRGVDSSVAARSFATLRALVLRSLRVASQTHHAYDPHHSVMLKQAMLKREYNRSIDNVTLPLLATLRTLVLRRLLVVSQTHDDCCPHHSLMLSKPCSNKTTTAWSKISLCQLPIISLTSAREPQNTPQLPFFNFYIDMYIGVFGRSNG